MQLKESGELAHLPLDFDPQTKEVLVEVDSRIVKHLKPHQAKGIKFLWDAVFESKKVCSQSFQLNPDLSYHCQL